MSTHTQSSKLGHTVTFVDIDEPPPPYEEDEMEAPFADFQATVGVPQHSIQVTCPKCYILIAVERRMKYFICPRCRTECSVAYPQDLGPKPQSMQLSPQSPSSPSFPSPIVTNDTQHFQNSPLSPLQTVHNKKDVSTSPSPSTSVSPYLNSSSPSFTSYRDPIELNNLNEEQKSRTQKDKLPKSSYANGSENDWIFFPEGTGNHFLRGFLLQQPVLFNLFMVLYLLSHPTFKKQEEEIDWYDSNKAKQGTLLGVFAFCLWFGILIWRFSRLSYLSQVIAITAMIFGPYLLVLIFWNALRPKKQVEGERMRNRSVIGSNRYDDCGNCYCNDDGFCCWYCFAVNHNHQHSSGNGGRGNCDECCGSICSSLYRCGEGCVNACEQICTTLYHCCGEICTSVVHVLGSIIDKIDCGNCACNLDVGSCDFGACDCGGCDC